MYKRSSKWAGPCANSRKNSSNTATASILNTVVESLQGGIKGTASSASESDVSTIWAIRYSCASSQQQGQHIASVVYAACSSSQDKDMLIAIQTTCIFVVRVQRTQSPENRRQVSWLSVQGR
jgi:hypothetical protein